jgi:3-methyladenine DNA glycosylase AlkC
MQPEKKFEFSDVINPIVVANIGNALKKVWKSFDVKQFENNVVPKLAPLAFKDRANVIAEEMYNLLPKDFGVTGQMLLDSFCVELAGPEFTGDSVFFYMPHGVYMSRHGLGEEHFELSMKFLYEMTKRFSAEFAIRPFLDKYPDKMLQKLELWAKDESQYVRRLVSEGTRPRLPWAPRIKVYDKDYTPIIKLLNQLKNDPELYVRRSVANHLNDLTKDRKELVISTLKKWNKKPSGYILWITKHALRTLVKKGDKDALELLGFSDLPNIGVHKFALSKEVLNLGEKLEIYFEISSERTNSQSLMVDYIIYFQKSNGKQSPKVFKLKIIELAGESRVVIQKKQLFQHLRTRVLYEGKHTVELQINGQSFGKKDFDLVF